MVKRTCDRCGKELEPVYFPFQSLNSSCGEQKPFESHNLSIIYNNGEKMRPVDLCLECDDLVSVFIFNPEIIERKYRNAIAAGRIVNEQSG